MIVPLETRAPTLPAEEPFLRRNWVFERLGWAVIAAVLLGGLLGLTGPGLFSSTQRFAPAGIFDIRFERFPHYLTETELTARILPPPGADTFEIWMDDVYRSAVDVERITPTPDRVDLDFGRKRYYFKVIPGAGPREVVFHVVYRRIGRVQGRIGARTGEGLPVTPFVFP
jgi:hypothetical protein